MKAIPEKLLEKVMPVLAYFLFIVVIVLLFGLVVRYAWSAPYLVCDPYPTDAPARAVPTEFVVTISGIPAPITTPAVDVTGGKAMKLDLGPLNLSGSRQITAKARNLWGMSADSSPFIFTAGPPGSPIGITLSATE